MANKITNKELNKHLDINEVVVSAGNVNLFIDTEEFYIDTSFNHITNDFKVSAYLDNQEIEFTENQKDIICNFLGNAEKQD
ncbi:hypothetical protein M1M24_gp38 [Polaribacter phage Freya_1]|uniref:Uncharacterized protein n=2 Tax=Freyavirus TaxID=2948713 RepID=A0A8E5EB55_9CAUD|nr:hypothetical protein M1M23_gp23 [Polaribacter phage Danklef_1]YP_010356727.1 hypothetical protein M1M24_gp38 [Polaribacter phage Freya_1]QQV90580.1 hypothetical protein Danklef2_24 [Polaribacter phage Danklef_2]QQV90657.1 hypothetical protein Danklef3_25 [Polaribacter phage Danklef_3]QQV90733.1 hypothetical protein Danklef4_24 [Polaribacter phage Danklef_4]QQV90811.1 hypothetical protein Danklef5_25 [Polaribacter phage Danklef_5]QQV90975.1 hypothetical protein Freya2_38 [Polaribacter phage